MQKITRSLQALAVLGLVVGLTGCSAIHAATQPALTGEPIKVGLATSLSGGSAMQGEGARRGIQMAIDDYNAKGGYKGRPVELIAYDDGANADKSLAAVTKLIKEDKVVAFFGPANSGNATKHLPLVKESGIPEIIPGATATALTQQYAGDKNPIFRVSNPDSGQVQTMLNWLVDKKGFKKLAVLHDTSGYGISGRDEVIGQMAKRNLTPVAVAAFASGQTDMTTQLQIARDANPEAIILYTLAPEFAAIIRSAEQLGYRVPMVGAWNMADPTVPKIVGPLVNNDFSTVVSFTVDANDKTKAFSDRVVKRYGENIFPMPTAQGYDAAQMLILALDKAGPDPAKIRDALENLSPFDAVTNAKPFTPQNHEAITAQSMFIATYKDGVLTKAQ